MNVIPEAFDKVCRHFHQDADLYGSTEGMVEAAVGSLDAGERIVVHRFVGKVLANGHGSDARGALRKSGSQLFFDAGSAWLVFQLLDVELKRNKGVTLDRPRRR